jgi:3-phenylpropionate/trans-cinnamate dioxygenase ferredoxin reductase component
MAGERYDYVVVGGGLAGASAIEGIRERDEEGSILLIGDESHPPYDRPPLSKKLWFGKQKVEDIFVKDQDFYIENNVDVAQGVTVVALNVGNQTITDNHNARYGYEKLLLVTGGTPRKLSIPGADLDGVCYFRYLDDYLRLRQEASEGKSALVIGGGFIGGEMAAALNLNKIDVTMIYPEPIILSRIFPESLGKAIQDDYIARGVKIVSGDVPTAIEKNGDKFVTKTREGKSIESERVIVGVGIDPAVGLAEMAKLQVDNGVVVNELLQSSKTTVYAAGDVANFPYSALKKQTRVEHWDNAMIQGKHAGRNMAGAAEPFNYMPYFFSDLFDFGFEAVGEVDSRLDTFMDWQKENETGVIYYLKDGRVRGAMMCNVWDKVDAARELIRQGRSMTPEDLRGAIR